MFKKRIYEAAGAFFKSECEKDKINVILEANEYFTADLWKTEMKHLTREYNLICTRNKYKIYKNISKADVLFCFGINSYFDYSNLKMLYLAGSEIIDAGNHDLVICNSKGISKEAIADYCLGLSYGLIYGVKEIVSRSMSHEWVQPLFSNFREKGLSGKVIGVAGLGNNGLAIVNIFRKSGCKVIGSDTDVSKRGEVDVFYDDIRKMLPQADILILALSAGPDSPELIGMEELKLMKKDSYLINISRGSVLNESDLYHALKNGIISAAAIDVVKKEPLSPFSRLWKLKNLIITPHIAGNVNMFTGEIMSDFKNKLKANYGV